MKTKRLAYAETARRGARMILGTNPKPFAPARMSKYAHWFTDPADERLIAVVTPGERPQSADEVLAYGLAWQHDRDLFLVVPTNMVAETRTRIAWLATEVRLFAFGGVDAAGAEILPADDEAPLPVPAASRAQLLGELAQLPERIPKPGALKPGHQTWLDGIDLAGLDDHSRGGYLSWHHEGLQVLRVTETKAGLRIQAGVQYQTAQPGREVFDKTFTTAPTPREVDVINAKVALAVEDGGSLTSQMREHKMQAMLIKQPELLGLTHLWREFPAWRGTTAAPGTPTGTTGRPGFIDFLGADTAGVLHVVETKIGHDPRVVLQALDYAIWVKANAEKIRARLKEQGHIIPAPSDGAHGATAAAPIHLVLGSGESGAAFNGYLAGQIEALAGDCKVSIHLTDQPTTGPLTLTKVSKADMWEPTSFISKPVAGPRWPDRLTTELAQADE